ncbi:hypothetical protein WJX77_011188 [Trebouxia sp. C0004]
MQGHKQVAHTPTITSDRHAKLRVLRSDQKPHAASREPITGSTQTQKCWGCKLALQTTAAAFKCGWCGAITDHSLRIQPRHRQMHNIAQRTFTALVAFAILVDATVGICWLLACLTSGVSLRLQQTAGCWAAANILTNFAVCVFGSPGCPHESISFTHTDPNVRRNQYDSCTYCQQCSFPKPPQAHHCRKCGCCVMDMDHHCFFLNNCVGRNNLKPFLLFLGWMLLGSLSSANFKGATVKAAFAAKPTQLAVPSMADWFASCQLEAHVGKNSLGREQEARGEEVS